MEWSGLSKEINKPTKPPKHVVTTWNFTNSSYTYHILNITQKL